MIRHLLLGDDAWEVTPMSLVWRPLNATLMIFPKRFGGAKLPTGFTPCASERTV